MKPNDYQSAEPLAGNVFDLFRDIYHEHAARISPRYHIAIAGWGKGQVQNPRDWRGGMTDRAYIRVSLDGKIPVRELCVDGAKICELSYHETLALALNATSSLRWENERIPANERAASSKR